MEIIKETILRKVYQRRKNWAHKYDFGHLLVIGGSQLYSGSPALNALAALKSGVDWVTVVAPERAADIVATFSPDMITFPLPGRYLKKSHLKVLMEFAQKAKAVVIGSGLGREKETQKAVREFLKRTKLPVVIDADAIHAVAGEKKVLSNKRFVITPHTREFFLLSGKKVKNNETARAKVVRQVSRELETTILLKGHVDVISDGKRVALNKTGNVYMTKGGTGDTLAGICGALLAREADTFTAACAAAYINGKAGDLAAKELKEGLTATDLLFTIPQAIL